MTEENRKRDHEVTHQIIKEQVDGLRRFMDRNRRLIKLWMEANCDRVEGSKESEIALFHDFKRWCLESGYNPAPKKEWSELMTEFVESRPDRQRWFYLGIKRRPRTEI